MRTSITLFIFVCIAILNFSCKQTIHETNTISIKQFNYPVLKDQLNNPVLRICINNDEVAKVLEAIKISLNDTHESNLSEVRIYYTGKDSLFNDKIQFGNALQDFDIPSIKGKQELGTGANYFWISYHLSNAANLLDKVTAGLDHLTVNGQVLTNKEVNIAKKLRIGIAVRDLGVDNVHTYRIPGLTTTNKGTLLAVYDVRRTSGRDLQGDIDIGLSRSIDKGRTWEAMRIVLDMGTWGNLPQKFNGVSDACILVDKNTNAIYVAGLWMHGVINADGEWLKGLNEASNEWNHQWRNKGSQPGISPFQTSQFLIAKSTDDGKTWSIPINITAQCKDPSWWLWAPAPGHGITLKDGTLVFPTQGRDENGLPFSNITYSKDGGETWETSNAASQNTTESMAVELSDGSIMLNMRDNRNRQGKEANNGRGIAVTTNLGSTWEVHPTSHSALIEPVCMGAIHKHDYHDTEGHLKSILLFSNPNSKFKRHKQTVKVSFDDGLTWPENYWIELDEGTGAGYSCLTSIDEDTIGILYEGSQAQMTFQTLNLEEILRGIAK